MEFVLVQPDDLPASLCDTLISLFEASPDQKPGVLSGGYREDIKKTMDITLRGSEWDACIASLNVYLARAVRDYLSYLDRMIPECQVLDVAKLHNSAFMVMRTSADGYFKWHTDQHHEPHQTRVLTYIWYLNTLEPGDGGETDFAYDFVRPEKGKRVMFPATWTYPHCGRPPAKDKYIVTGWLYADTNGTCI